MGSLLRNGHCEARKRMWQLEWRQVEDFRVCTHSERWPAAAKELVPLSSSTQEPVSVYGENVTILDITRLIAGKIRPNGSTKSQKMQEDWEVNSWLLENDNINPKRSSWALMSNRVPEKQNMGRGFRCIRCLKAMLSGRTNKVVNIRKELR